MIVPKDEGVGGELLVSPERKRMTNKEGAGGRWGAHLAVFTSLALVQGLVEVRR
jgi:hypothetical protein